MSVSLVVVRFREVGKELSVGNAFVLIGALLSTAATCFPVATCLRSFLVSTIVS